MSLGAPDEFNYTGSEAKGARLDSLPTFNSPKMIRGCSDGAQSGSDNGSAEPQLEAALGHPSREHSKPNLRPYGRNGKRKSEKILGLK